MACNIPKSANFCLAIIKRYTITNDVFWNDFQCYRNTYRSELNSIYTETRKNTHGIAVPVVMLKNGYCIYFGMAFDRKKTSQLSSLSLQFYDQESELFRIDWDGNKIDGDISQPHWHFHNEVKMLMDNRYEKDVCYDDYGSFVNYLEIAEQTKKQYDVGRIHFYATYNNSKIDNLDFLDDKILCAWLEYTMNNVNNQLHSIKNHSVNIDDV